MKILFFFLAFILPLEIYGEFLSISFGPVQYGQPRIPVDLKDFNVSLINTKLLKYKTGLIKDSVQWIRSKNNLLIPRARLGVIIQGNPESNIYFQYQNQPFIPEKRGKLLYIELLVHLFSPETISIFDGNEKIGSIHITSKEIKKNKNTKQIDYSCAKYNLQLKGLEDEYISVGCHLERKGIWGNETPRLEVTWATPNFYLPNSSVPPYLSILNGPHPSEVTLENNKGEKRKISISAKLPKKLNRIKTAYGLGPYIFKSSFENEITPSTISPGFFLYGKLEINDSTSIRGFNALVYNGTIFNNFGFYFAYDLARALDDKILIVPLLGIQGLTFIYNKQDQGYTQIIYPQGFELVFQHFLGIENYTVVYGMFLSTETKVDYQNIWLRWGKGMFWELNYINWAHNQRKAEMYGLSIGLPLLSFF